MKTLKIWIWVMALVMLIIVSLYFNNFRWELIEFNCFSQNKADWGTFGDYLSGVFAVFNLGVVVLLTLYVKRNEDSRDDQLIKEQIKRDERELEFQKKKSELELRNKKIITITQLRYDMISNLESDFEKLMNDRSQDELKYSIQNLSLKVLNIKLQRDYLFKVLRQKTEKEVLLELSKRITDAREAVKYDINNYDSFYAQYISKIYIQKFKLIGTLQKFTLEELNLEG